ncbi:MAG: 3-hydroxyacyl-CoA dehydrogenase/enoyl-CoA hydratase family protein, partial [Acidobacteria bacterium]|nr:3-hydroxyacyl-CoA dehydrogenase/enoyl-CoA hydratase family protein [Acidobacteriota bacterium]
MGARIAAHLANAGIPALLLDQTGPPEDRNRLARTGLESVLNQKPSGFFLPEYRNSIALGNFDDDLERLTESHWIIEAVVENLEIKRRLLERVAQVRAAEAVVSTNTSGIPIASIAEGLPEDFRKHWLGTHFFNPPRYMHLVEIIPGRETLPAVVEWVSGICDRRLGK